MIHFSNLFLIYVQPGGILKIDFKTTDPMNVKESETAATIFLTRSDADALAKTLMDLLAKPEEPEKTVKLN